MEAEAGSLAALLEELAAGMFELMAEVDAEDAGRWLEVAVESATVEDLVVDSLSELLYRSEVEDLVFCSFRAETSPERLAATIRAGGVPAKEAEEMGPPIKAVTYHDLHVEERGDGWYGRVYFDV